MISVVGLGPGSSDYLMPLVTQLIADCDWVVGAPRQLEAVPHNPAKARLLDKKLSDLIVWLNNNHQQNIVVLASGDPMLYGIGKFISTQIPRENFQIISGVSSIQYLFARIALDMNEVYLSSSHGKTPDFDFMLQHKKVALVTDAIIGPYQIAQQIIERGLKRTLVIGENLSYPDEQISVLSAQEVTDRPYQMNVVVIIDER